MYYMFGLMAKPGTGSTPIIFSQKPVELIINDGKFVMADSAMENYNSIVEKIGVEGLDQWWTSKLQSDSDEECIFYSLISSDKGKVDVVSKVAELILQLIHFELKNQDPSASPV